MPDPTPPKYVSRSLAPLRDIVGSLIRAADGTPPLGTERRRFVRRVRVVGNAAVPALVRALASSSASEAEWAAYLLVRLGGGRVVAALSALIEDPRSPEEGRARASALLADLSAPGTAQELGPELSLLGSVSEFLRCLDGASDVKMAVEMVTRSVPEAELATFVAELARHGGATALPLLDALLDEHTGLTGREASTTTTLGELRARLLADEASACEPRVSPKRGPAGGAAKAERQSISRRAPSRRRVLEMVERGEYESAQKHLQKACAARPDDVEALSHLGACALHLGDPDAALTHFERCVALERSQALHHWNVAAAATASRRVCQSYSALLRYLERADASDGARQRRQQARRLARNYEELIRSAHPGKRIEDVIDGEQLFLAALADLEAGLAEASVVGFRRVLALLPDHHPSWGNLGTAELALGNREEAMRCLRQALEIKPDYEVARENLALIETRH